MSKDLCLENLAEFDGGSIAIAFNEALRKILFDVEDRSGLNKARKLTLELTFLPKGDARELESIVTSVKVRERIPDKESRECTLLPNMGRKAMQFDPGSTITRTAPGQNDFDFEE